MEIGAGQIEMEDVDRLPQLGRDPIPQAAGVVTGRSTAEMIDPGWSVGDQVAADRACSPAGPSTRR